MSEGAPATLAAGTRIGPYEVLGLLGAGAMGEVYRARDIRLGRNVAIKILPEALALDGDRAARFEREARMLASLNHPHIAAIYGLEEARGRRALVLELVPGTTLAAAIAAGIEVTRALALAWQIADALAAAHAQGIIHRDLKPTNIQLAPGDIIKVLDFGVAKMWDAGLDPAGNASTMTGVGTRDGVIVGTAAYMSPEQARGLPVDQRTDVWAFGCVLFEMLAGRAAFARATFSDTVAAVLEREPDWSALPGAVSRPVRALLRRCLAKDPSERPASMGDVRHQLETCTASRFRRAIPVLPPFRLRRSAYSAIAVIAIGSIAAAGYWSFRPAPLPRLLNPGQITAATGVEDYPSLSPDTNLVAYESNQRGNWDIWVSEVGGGAAVNRTLDNPGDDRYPAWSPDGRRIAFWSTRDGNAGFYVMPSVGGAAEKVADHVYGLDTNHSAPVWSPDGRQLAFVVYVTSGSRYEATLQVITVATGQSTLVTMPGSQEGRLDLSWSHDGRRLAYIDIAQQPAETSRLMVLDLETRIASAISDASLNIRSPFWAPDDASLFFVCNQASTWDLWRQRLTRNATPRGPKERLTTGVDILHAALSADGTRLVFAKGRWVSNVWRVPIGGGRTATWTDAQQLTFDQAFIEFAQVSPDGESIAFSSDRLGNQDLWKKRLDRDDLVQLTRDPSLEWAPYWSPDGSQLAFYSNRSGNREIWIMPADGGPGRQLTHTGTSLNAGGSWSPDGTEIAYRSERLGSSDVWVTSVDGEHSRVLAASPAAEYAHAWSPHGDWIAFTSDRGGVRQLWRVPSKGGEPERLTIGTAASPVWSRDGTEIYYAGSGGGRSACFWATSLAARDERCAVDLRGRRGHIGFQPPSTDGRYLYFMWRDDLGDVWIMDVR